MVEPFIVPKAAHRHAALDFGANCRIVGTCGSSELEEVQLVGIDCQTTGPWAVHLPCCHDANRVSCAGVLGPVPTRPSSPKINRIVCGPQSGFERRNSTMRASTTGDI